MKVLILNNTRYKGKSYPKGSETNIDKETAERWINIGIAEEIKKSEDKKQEEEKSQNEEEKPESEEKEGE